jgi:hypothetical protein
MQSPAAHSPLCRRRRRPAQVASLTSMNEDLQTELLARERDISRLEEVRTLDKGGAALPLWPRDEALLPPSWSLRLSPRLVWM